MIKDRLLELASEIADTKFDLLREQEKLTTERDKQKMWGLVEMANIANAVDDNGKAKYSNEVKRNAELQNRKEQSEEYKVMEVAIKMLEKEVALKNILIDKLYNEQGNLRAICRLEGESK